MGNRHPAAGNSATMLNGYYGDESTPTCGHRYGGYVSSYNSPASSPVPPHATVARASPRVANGAVSPKLGASYYGPHCGGSTTMNNSGHNETGTLDSGHNRHPGSNQHSSNQAYTDSRQYPAPHNRQTTTTAYQPMPAKPKVSSTKPQTPTAPTKSAQKGFLAQLFTRSPNAVMDATPPATPSAAKQQSNDILGEKAVLLKDRPALRLDTRLICKYEVLSIIGKGSFSQVLRVQDRLTRQFYAVKLVRTDSDVGAVNNELSILSRVQHPFVIRLEEVFRGVSRLFIVMEMASGGEMYDRVVSKGRYTESEARAAVRMLLAGLDYLHGIHVTHRDLKPENLLYSDDRPEARLLITDFGLAHQSKNANEKMFETCGTPEYIAPEILLRVPYSNKVDLWAVGVITYILMSGIMPFDDDNRSRLYSHIITADYVYYPMFWAGSDLAKQFVDDLLDTNAERRMCASEALKHEWISGEEKSHANSNSRARQTRRPHSPTSTEHSMQRTRSSRSIRSVTRSDHGHRVDPREVDKLADDLERLARNRHRHNNNDVNNNKDHKLSESNNSGKTGKDYPSPTTKNYGMI